MLKAHSFSNLPKSASFILLFVLMMCLALSACEPPPPPPTPTPNYSSSSYGLDLELEREQTSRNDLDATSNNNSRKPSLIIIVDRSNSMTKCSYPKLAFVHKIIISFLTQLFDKRVEIYLTELPRSDSSLSLTTITANNIPSENDLKPYQQGQERLHNNFQKAFRDIKNQFEVYTVLLLSDGAFNDRNNTGLREDMDRWLQENDEFKRNLFMLLWDCPRIYEPQLSSMYSDDKNMWESHLFESSIDRLLEIKSDSIDQILDKLGEFLRKMIEHSHLNKALPKEGAGWLEPSPQKKYKLTNIPGYTNRITLRVWVFTLTENITATLVFESANSIPENISLGGQEKTILNVPRPNPKNGCVSLTPLLSFNEEIYLGYYELIPSFFHDEFKPELQVRLSTSDGLVFNKDHLTLWNNPGITLIFTGILDGHGGADRSKFNEYAPCYAFHIEVLLNSTSVPTMPSDEMAAKQIWGKDESLSVPIELPEGVEGDVLFRFKLSLSTGEYLIEWTSKDNIRRRYYPIVTFKETESPNDSGSTNDKSFTLSVTSTSSSLNPDNYRAYFYVQDQDKSMVCVSNPVQGHIKILNFGESVPVTNIAKDMDLRGGDDKFWIFDNKLYIRGYREVVTNCSYRYLILQWDQDIPSYACNLENKVCERADLLLPKQN